MVAELYIIPESFAYNANFSKAEIEQKTIALSKDLMQIKQYKDTNKLYVHASVYEVVFVDGKTLADLLYYTASAKRTLDRDVFNALQKIIVEAADTSCTMEEVMEVLLPNHDEHLCHGLIAFNKIENVEESMQLIYDLGGWYKFRRNFLSIYPKNPDFFIDECIKYFPSLYFHPRVRGTIRAILNDCPKRIVFHLEALNDNFRTYHEEHTNRTIVLKEFSIGCKLDEIASIEGNAHRKPIFTFEFETGDGGIEKICCEPHLKLCSNDNVGDTSYSTDRRIYFHEGKEGVQGGKILIGHIGPHL